MTKEIYYKIISPVRRKSEITRFGHYGFSLELEREFALKLKEFKLTGGYRINLQQEACSILEEIGFQPKPNETIYSFFTHRFKAPSRTGLLESISLPGMTRVLFFAPDQVPLEESSNPALYRALNINNKIVSGALLVLIRNYHDRLCELTQQ